MLDKLRFLAGQQVDEWTEASFQHLQGDSDICLAHRVANDFLFSRETKLLAVPNFLRINILVKSNAIL